MALPFHLHPLYQLRRVTIIVAALGLFLCCVSYTPYGDFLFLSALVLGLSILLCTLDLVFYAANKAGAPDSEPRWPTRKWMAGDVALAIILQLLFWSSVGNLNYGYSYHMNIGGAYGILADLLCSLLHAWTFWKQLMARSEKRWLAKLAIRPCPQCGYTVHQSGAEETPGNADESASFPCGYTDGAVVTPQSTQSIMEEGLLIGSDYNGGYGSIDTPEPTLEPPEEIVVGKIKKGKKSAASSSKTAYKKPSV